MCGIVGIFGSRAGEQQQQLAGMLRAVHGRGETDEVFVAADFCVGTRRLKIVDPERAVQPIFNEDRSQAIIFNGEIFNYKSLRARLQAKHTFSTASDTETILHAYEEYGEHCVDQLDGQWAFAIYDRRNRTLFAARDHWGVVPLYFVHADDTLYLASVIRALTFLGKPIKVVPPGHMLDLHGIPRPFYQPTYALTNLPRHEVVGRLKAAVQDAVAKRVDTPLPIGVIYSGGIDSSIVLHEASKRHTNVTAFTIGAADSEDCALARRFCQERNIRHIVIPQTRQQIRLSTIRQVIQATELNEYLDIINAVVSLPLFRTVHEHDIKVVLSGDGSDELFGGYDMYRQVASDDHPALLLHNLLTLHRTELQRVDRCSMAYAVETRVPFLDRAVVDLALQMPLAWKNYHGVDKWPIRAAFKDELPSYILERPKNPLSYSSGIHEWIRRYKPFFRLFYRQEQYDLHQPIKMDFSYLLTRNNHDLATTMVEDGLLRDYPTYELVKEAVKASIRTYLINPLS